jgi:hypothetical protein
VDGRPKRLRKSERANRSRETIPQGPKPIYFVGFIGTTKVVPFQNLASMALFQNRLNGAFPEAAEDHLG